MVESKAFYIAVHVQGLKSRGVKFPKKIQMAGSPMGIEESYQFFIEGDRGIQGRYMN